jgi:acyl carrier protein
MTRKEMENQEKPRSAVNAVVLRQHLPLLGPFVAPGTITEQKLAKIWCDSLGMDKVGIDDTYEDLGGDSLLAASIFIETEKAFGVAVPSRSLASDRTVRLLARRIDTLVAKRMK